VSVQHVVVAVLLAVAAVAAVLSVAGVALMGDTYDRLHYLAPVSVLSSAAVAIAVLVEELFNTRGIKALLVFGVLAALNPLVSHATARAARVRRAGDWRLSAKERP
jgi:multisubunit Na+/H+ antiporter MnhG subunit